MVFTISVLVYNLTHNPSKHTEEASTFIQTVSFDTAPKNVALESITEWLGLQSGGKKDWKETFFEKSKCRIEDGAMIKCEMSL